MQIINKFMSFRVHSMQEPLLRQFDAIQIANGDTVMSQSRLLWKQQSPSSHASKAGPMSAIASGMPAMQCQPCIKLAWISSNATAKQAEEINQNTAYTHARK